MLIYKIISLLRYKAAIAVDSFCWVDLFGLSFWAKDVTFNIITLMLL
jgi:hypothetical protein